jgi:hypothetical protein
MTSKNETTITALVMASMFISGLMTGFGLGLGTEANPAESTVPADCPGIGDTCSDKTIYAGRSPETGERMFTLSADAPLLMKWEAATDYAADLSANGHTDWRLPTKEELHVLYENRNKGALKGTFDESASHSSGRHWSASEHPDDGAGLGWAQRFSDGNRGWYWKYDAASVRLVRSEPLPS